MLDVMFLALCKQVVSQAPQHFNIPRRKPLVMVAFPRQSVCSVMSLHSGMSRVSNLFFTLSGTLPPVVGDSQPRFPGPFLLQSSLCMEMAVRLLH